jgi:hypothetical protein
MDDFAACAELCESHGFSGPADILRTLADGRLRLYLVRALVPFHGAEFYGFDTEDLSPAGRKVFLDPAAADRHARSLTARALRNFKLAEYNSHPSNLSEGEYCREVGAILGVPYQPPDEPGARVFPEWATDEQLLRLVPILDVELFDVVEFGADLDQRPGR